MERARNAPLSYYFGTILSSQFLLVSYFQSLGPVVLEVCCVSGGFGEPVQGQLLLFFSKPH